MDSNCTGGICGRQTANQYGNCNGGNCTNPYWSYQNYANQNYNNQDYTNQNYNNQNYTNLNYNNQNYTNQNYNNQNYASQNYGNQNYTNQNYGNQNYGVPYYNNMAYQVAPCCGSLYCAGHPVAQHNYYPDNAYHKINSSNKSELEKDFDRDYYNKYGYVPQYDSDDNKKITNNNDTGSEPKMTHDQFMINFRKKYNISDNEKFNLGRFLNGGYN